MNQRAGFGMAVTLAVAAALTGGCQNGVTGPSLSATFHDVRLQPTVAGLEGGENVCCCHLAGRFTNTSSVAVNAEVRFVARAADGQPLGTAIDILENVPPDATRLFLAIGVQSACKDVSLAQVVADGSIRLKALWQSD